MGRYEEFSPPALFILIATGDEMLRDFLQRHLKEDGYHLIIARDGKAVLSIAKQHVLSLVLLDYHLSEPDGLELCRLLRTHPKTAFLPILMLARNTDEVDTIVGLEVGADDYLTNPFQWRMLRARIRALLRRSSYREAIMPPTQNGESEEAGERVPEPLIVRGGLHIDLAGRKVSRGGQSLELSRNLFDLLVYLVQNPGMVLSRKELILHMPKLESPGDERILDIYIHRLREKIEEDPTRPKLIQTVRGIGYRFLG